MHDFNKFCSCFSVKSFFFIRPHWEGYHKNFGLFLNNRSGMIMVDDNEYLKPLNEPYKKKCF